MATNVIPINVSDNVERIHLRAVSSGISRPLNNNSGNPYYVGARAYVEQNENGATITIIDKEGETTATVNNGADGTDGVGIVDISLTSTSGLVDTYTILYTDGSTSTFNVTNGADGGGTGSYSELTDKPSIEGVTLSGDKTFPQLNLDTLSNTDIESIFNDLI